MWININKQLSNIINQISYDYIIIRIDSISKSIYNFIKDNKNIILDYPTAPIEEYLLKKNYYQKLAFKYNKLALKHSKLNIVTIPDTNYINSYFMPNSLNIDKYKQKSIYRKPSITKEISFLLMSSNYGDYTINGYDRLLKSIQNHLLTSKDYTFKLYVAGKKVDEAKLFFDKFHSPYITMQYLGFKTIEELNDIINNVDLGVNDIGYHRDKVFNNSTLKTVDYIGWGLPFIVSHNDSNLDKTDSFFIKVSDNDEIFNINNIIFYLESIRNNCILEMKEKADKISLKNNLITLINYLKTTFN